MIIVNSSKIIDGKEVLSLVDSKGLPLEAVNIHLREKGMGFDVVQFVKAALASKNFTYDTIKQRLVEAMLPQNRDEFIKELDSVYDNEGRVNRI